MLNFNVVSIDHEGQTDSPEAGGMIEQDQATYKYGETVTLTAVPEPGWSLSSWSGAGLSGSQLVKTFTITQDETIDVQFNQDKYDLDITINGPGDVTVSSPAASRGYYIYGDVITLTAVETVPDYKFRGWSGAINSTQNPITFTVEGGLEISALFSDRVFIYLPIVVK